MDLGSIFLILALLILVGLFVGRPLIEDAKTVIKKEENKDHNRSMLMAERDRILNAVQELDFDHVLGKIPEEDYPQQRNALLQRGAIILRELDSLAVETEPEAADVRLEAAIAARRADMVKLSGQEFEPMAVTPNGHGIVAERKPNGLHSADDDLEAILAQRKRTRQDKAAGFCSQCGSPIQKSDLFCPKCGSKTL